MENRQKKSASLPERSREPIENKSQAQNLDTPKLTSH
jgi:hypothetical protein